MNHDNDQFTLASVLQLPITSLSTFRVVGENRRNELKTLFLGTFTEFEEWLHHNDEVSLYTVVKYMTIGNGNANGIIRV